VRRICPQLGDGILLPLIERMAERQLAHERARLARQRFGRVTRRSRKSTTAFTNASCASRCAT
jgi:hypothetical protein